MSSSWASEVGRIAGIAAMAFFALLTAAQAVRYFRTALGLSDVPLWRIFRKRRARDEGGPSAREGETGADEGARSFQGVDRKKPMGSEISSARALSAECEGMLGARDATKAARRIGGEVRAEKDVRSEGTGRAGFGDSEKAQRWTMEQPLAARRCPAARADERSARGEMFSAGQILWMVLALFLASRLLMLAATSICAAANGSLEYYWRNLWGHWSRWDARHYLDLMEQWYVTEGDLRLSLVFFPLYPLLGRGLVLLGVPALTAGMLISNAALIGCGWVLTALVQESYGAKIARRALALFFFCPVTFFFSMPYTESVFLLTTLLAVWLARRGRFGWAVVCGALAANARMVGMATAIPIFWEMLRRTWDDYARRNVHARRTDGAFVKRALGCVLRVLPVSVGLLLYLALNWQLYRNPLQFLIFQKENWSQQMGSLANTVHYTLANALVYDKLLYRLGVWIPQSLTLFGAIALMTATARRQHPGDAAYALVYFYMSVSPTWLLSGTRYVAAMYALYPMLALLPRRKRGFAILFGIEIILLVWMTILGINIGYVL